MDEHNRARRALSRTPMIMSVLALVLVVATALGATGSHPAHDEGWQAHTFQLLMILQVPVILLNVVAGRRSWPILTAQSLLWIAALSSVALVD